MATATRRTPGLGTLRGLINGLRTRHLTRAVHAALCVSLLHERNHGHFRSALRWECVDADGNPIPWYTYPATAYLRQLDYGDQHVFEFGSGNSTRFWGALAREVVSVEGDPAWHAAIAPLVGGNVTIHLRPDEPDYVRSLAEQGRRFDIIVVDGQYRRACAEAAIGALAPGGMIILDNADWYPETARALRDADLIEVDFAGPGPINGYTWTTSLFLSRDFRPHALGECQPHPPLGGIADRAPDDCRLATPRSG